MINQNIYLATEQYFNRREGVISVGFLIEYKQQEVEIPLNEKTLKDIPKEDFNLEEVQKFGSALQLCQAFKKTQFVINEDNTFYSIKNFKF